MVLWEQNLTKIEGIEEDTAKALIERAKEFHKKDQEDISQRIKDLGLADDLIKLKGLTPGMLVTLGEQKILNLEDFALSKPEADELIMSARNIVYKD